MMVLGDERKAREIALFRQGKFRDVKLAKQQAAKLEDMFDADGRGRDEGAPLIIKADVQGSPSAGDALTKLSTDEVKVNIMHAGVGGITESDVKLALASKRRHHRLQHARRAAARKLAETRRRDPLLQHHLRGHRRREGGAVRHARAGASRRTMLGRRGARRCSRSRRSAPSPAASSPRAWSSAAQIRVLRDNVVIHDGELESLKRFKDDVREVKAGFECGMALKSYNDIKVGDQIEVFEVVEVARTL